MILLDKRKKGTRRDLKPQVDTVIIGRFFPYLFVFYPLFPIFYFQKISKRMNFRLPTCVEEEIEEASSRRTLLSQGGLVRALLCSAAPRVRLVELHTCQVSTAEAVRNRPWLRTLSKKAQGTWLAGAWLGSENATPGRGGGFRGPAPLTSHGMVLPPKPFGNWLEGYEGRGMPHAQSFKRSFPEVSWAGLGQSHRSYDEEWPALERASCPPKGSTREPEVGPERFTPSPSA